ncbi:hypothetical protein P175DRAFT_0478344 [Aspergillus ochraceoroseus IBT 24754]|uniref:BZIP domain-containing protein n=1 Tax=Aspergillus ochraceoroseus IBT 24754 TaxID=1392256 RepID=A0A2T5LW71_9EURO|nr:uncharacterized protein P175DRAFT_0478344 [Aspergillus ochraceoroseus IBT 24754]PTU20493.1 hypothetical protein P175DRAFT_0478344 [Aspergillus ochraceoroseus IBT 24754]
MNEMDPALEQKRLDRLARVRENQRKCRARRQDHIRDLEEKVVALQRDAHRKDVEHRLSIQRIEAENKKLRYLLSCLGLPADALETYLQAGDDPMMAQKVAIPALQRPPAKSQPRCQDARGAPCSATRDCPPVTPSLETPVPRVPCTDDKKVTNGEKSCTGDDEEPREPKILPLCACPSGDGEESVPASDEVLDTTLCAIAETLIHQYNTHGVDISEIQQKLRAGFSRGIASEGCRVQNHLLFQVLDEISGD